MISRIKVLLLLIMMFFACNIIAQEPDATQSFSIDLWGITYNQYSLSYERLLGKHISICGTLGYSPQGLFNFYGNESNYSSYFLFQIDAKSYILSNKMKDLYMGCGIQFDIAPNPLVIKYSDSINNSSAVLATYAEVGWKFFIHNNTGFYIDPCFIFYTATPLNIVVNENSSSKIWGYKLWAPMMSLSTGFAF